MNQHKETKQIVCEAVKQVAGVERWQLLNGDRHREVVFCRFIVAHEMIERTSMDIYAIAEWMHKEPKTITYYLNRYEHDYGHYGQFKRMADKIKQALDERL